MKKEPKFKWKSQTIASDFEQIQCPEYDKYKDFKMEPSGCYVLIRVTEEEPAQIECAICNKDHEIIKVFFGKIAQELYHSIFKYEREYGVEWFTDKDHIAYLGKEFKKAELVLLASQATGQPVRSGTNPIIPKEGFGPAKVPVSSVEGFDIEVRANFKPQ